MYKVLVRVAPSTIDGNGVFTQQDISKDSIVWLFTNGHDHTMTDDEHTALSNAERDRLDKTGYLSPWTNLWVFPPENDSAQYTNHSKENNLSVLYDKNISPEPYFVANRDIKTGEELTNNYHEFDKITRETRPKWAS